MDDFFALVAEAVAAFRQRAREAALPVAARPAAPALRAPAPAAPAAPEPATSAAAADAYSVPQIPGRVAAPAAKVTPEAGLVKALFASPASAAAAFIAADVFAPPVALRDR